MNVLEGKNIKLRAPEPEDLEIMYQWENDTKIWHVSNTLTPFSKFTLRKYIEESHLDIFEARQLRFMIDTIDHPTRTIGTIDLFDFDPHHLRAGIGILIGDNYDRGKGFAKDALEVVIDYCNNVLMLHQLFCNIHPENENSLKLFQNYGFIITGEKKDWNRTTNGWSSELFLQRILKE